MKRALILILLASIIVLGLPIPAAAADCPTPPAGAQYEALYAGRDMTLVGFMAVWQASGNLYVQYNTTSPGGWQILETHLAIASSTGGIPQTKSGNPIPGQFPYSRNYSPPVTCDTYQIALSSLPSSGWLVIAAHAVVRNISSGIEETAWGDCTPFPDARKWAKYFWYQR